MLIIPAIDLQNGACVRLKQGQFNQQTQFSVSPLERMCSFQQAGAQRVHIVDLDGARTGVMQHLSLIKEMLTYGLEIQAGGGIRSQVQAERCLAAGIKKIVLGSIALTNPQLTKELIISLSPENIILALDVNIKDALPIPAIHGWQHSSSNNLWEITAAYQALGIKTILCTDIACDGMMKGPNFALYEEALDRFPEMEWQASGGIRHEEDIKKLAKLGVAAAILGLSLYKGQVDLAQCLRNYAA
ncbi:HisA/HisF-related TIM barrel protein [Legionella sp. km772]|uniref:1-(5-phosphoribosyl)-5-[(5- phosphoribosylamino)methylideneamino]imidazole-4- carboxamide isomerase n=1 Tax=Legionella sp. km772 TaxID=2498111 RepID=UPI000F8DEF81|nr:1-(5-phosphoribosyl)-5-[(5-phosphoribosylamino)methylideneamino] imidazole-4-carboxamide isomerase [Legionella sp. km772]RUR12378.1 1-(5-phosphoribosyl)-5-[(5-phosphoribosylamino)methylideneamino] imidazole-4-carboxamide isomerase [Legionella sp. km772]